MFAHPKTKPLVISMPTPEKETILYLYNYVSLNFLWKFKLDKVKRSVITQECCSGGMKMVYINNFIILITLFLKMTMNKKINNIMLTIDRYFFTINGYSFLQKLYDFRDTFGVNAYSKSIYLLERLFYKSWHKIS